MQIMVGTEGLGGQQVAFYSSSMWKSKLQKCVALSSIEAEYVAASEACKSLVWLNQLLNEIGAVNETSVPVLQIDNQSAIKFINGSGFYERSKHIETRYHYIRQLVKENKVNVSYIPTNRQAADILTKGLPFIKLKLMKEFAGMVSTSQYI